MNQNQPNNQQRNFTDVGSANFGIAWDPRATEKNGMQYIPGVPTNRLEGYLTKIHEGIPTKYANPMTLYSIVVLNPDGSLGTTFSVVEDSFLADKVRAIPLGTFICLEYKGKTLKKNLPPQPWSKTNSYHTWFVGADYHAVPFQSLPQGHAQQAPPKPTNSQPVSAPVFQQQAPVYNQAPSQNNGQNVFQQHNVQNTNPVQYQAPPQNQGFVQPPPSVYQAPAQGSQGYANPGQAVPQTTWTPPPTQQVYNTPQGQNFQQPAPAQQTPQQNQFGGPNPFPQQNDDLPF